MMIPLGFRFVWSFFGRELRSLRLFTKEDPHRFIPSTGSSHHRSVILLQSMLVLVNLTLLWALYSRALFSTRSSNILTPFVHMNQSARQRKKSTSADSKQREALKEANISFQPNKFLVMQYTHICILILVGLFVSLYFFYLSSEARTRRTSRLPFLYC